MYDKWLDQYVAALKATEITIGGQPRTAEEGFKELLDITLKVRAADRTVFFAGNGASAAMASHYAVDFWKNGKVKAQTFFDTSQVTAISNDLSYADVFSFPLQNFGRAGDLYVGISSSGNSENVVRAAKVAKEKQILVVGFTGFKPDNRLRALSDVSFFVPAGTYGFVESAHAVLLHYWMDLLMEQAS